MTKSNLRTKYQLPLPPRPCSGPVGLIGIVAKWYLNYLFKSLLKTGQPNQIGNDNGYFFI